MAVNKTAQVTNDRQVKCRYGLLRDCQKNDLITSDEERNADTSLLDHDLGN